MRRLLVPLAALSACAFTLYGCCDEDDDDDDIIIVQVLGISASDFLTLDDYLSDPAVDRLFDFMSRNNGSSPPNVEGTYSSNGIITASSIPGVSVGDTSTSQFCLGPAAGQALEISILDPTATDAGAFSFIEGSSDLFTAYTAFISLQTGPNGRTCEVHEVVVLSGQRQSDGSLNTLFIGTAIVGLVGDCGSLEVDQIQVSQSTAVRTGASCVGSFTPGDPSKVLVEVANFLVTDVEVSVDGNVVDVAPLLSSLIFEVDPGFQLDFESVRPINENGDPMGTVLAETFSVDTQPAGRFSFYTVDNIIGDDTYFAPLISNQLSTAVSVAVNAGTPAAFDCDCQLDPSPLAQYVLGYHPYDVDQLPVAPADTNVIIDDGNAGNGTPDFEFDGPFILGRDSGSISIILPP